MDKTRHRLLADELIYQKWTPDEIEKAMHLICSEPDLAKDITYSGAVTPAVFARAREMMTSVDSWAKYRTPLTDEDREWLKAAEKRAANN